MLHIEQISSSHFHRGLLNGCVGCRSVGQWGDGPGGLPTTLCIPGHLTRHRPTPARSESRCGPARTWCRVIDNCAVTQSFFSRNQHHYCFFFHDLQPHFRFSNTAPNIQDVCRKACGVFLYGYKLGAGHKVCTSLTAQGKINSLEGHSLICLGGLEPGCL